MERRTDAVVRSGVRERSKTARMWMRGKRGTLRETMPLKRVTVCVGTSWEKAIRKADCRATVPLMLVRLSLSAG